jgi:hypothetical protein
MRIPEQLRRLGVVVAILVAAILVLRFVVIPRAYFSTALHEAATVRREVARPIAFAGMATCRECHSDVYDTKVAGFHRGLSCETCHGPSAKHAENPESVKPDAPRDRKFCPVCHAYDSARPTGFPQIDPVTHNPAVACITCHNAHDPAPPVTPRDCSACHRQIWNTKAVSAHAQLDCTTCHEVPEEHKQSPRAVRPTKPETRDFCGGCHATGQPDADVPQVDLTTHGGSYLCWQCHYPHLPEGAR